MEEKTSFCSGQWKRHLGDIETKDELEGEEVLVLVAEDAELLKGELHLLVLADQPPLGQGQETP